MSCAKGFVTVNGVPVPVLYPGETDLRIVEVKGGHIPMNTDRGTMTVLDTEKVLLSIAAKDQGGVNHAIPADQFSWSSSDSNIVALMTEDEVKHDDGSVELVALDPYTRMARTPNPGSAVVTVQNPVGDTETLTIVVQISGPGETGLSAGAPQPE